MVSPGGFTEVAVLGISHALAAGSEEVTLTATTPAGIKVQYTPSSPVDLSGSTPLNVTLVVEASSTAAVGNDSITIKGVSGSNSQSATFNLRVVQYRVVMEQDQFLPSTLNVTVGGTVYWQNLDGPAAGCAGGGVSSGNGQHNVLFTTLPGANSSAISQFALYSYTFTTPGSYFYYSSLNAPSPMNGTVNVLAANGAGIGNVAALPVFSSLEGSGQPVTAAVPIAGAPSEPVGALDEPSPVAGGSALSRTFMAGAHEPSLSGLVSDAGAVGLVGLVASCVAMVMVALGRRSLTAISLGSRMRVYSHRGTSGAAPPLTLPTS